MKNFLRGLETFIVTLIKSVFAAWIGLFMLVYPLLIAAGVVLGDSAMGVFFRGQFWQMVAFFTVMVFCLVWKNAYADKLSSWVAVLRMKWDLRGVGKD